jgi:PTH1 family peptidyl-tRNA hydrolase
MVGKAATILVLPDTFMNKSGNAVVKFVKSVKAGEKLIVVQDDLDLPLGKIKICFDRGSGGHKGIESIMRAIKTKRFWRIRVGVTPATASGKLKKPDGEDAVSDFIVGAFKTVELEEVQKIAKRVSKAIEVAITEGPMKAMNAFNTSA